MSDEDRGLGMNPGIGVILSELRRDLLARYGRRLKGLVLFGSHARKKSTVDSDIDVAAVIEGLKNPVQELERMGPSLSRISLKHDALIALYPVSAGDFESRESPLLMNIRKEGIRL